MPFIPAISAPVPLLDACVYSALGDLTPSAQASGEARLELSFSAGSILLTIATAERALAQLKLDPQAFHEVLLTLTAALCRIGGHQVSAHNQQFRLAEAQEHGISVDGARLTALWPPRTADTEPPLTILAHACSDEGSLAVVVHLAPDAARTLVSAGASFLADLVEAADQIQSASGLSLALAPPRV